MLTDILGLMKDAVIVLGGVLIAWGGVQIGKAIPRGDGTEIAVGVGWIVGGAVVMAAAAYFGSIQLGSLAGL